MRKKIIFSSLILTFSLSNESHFSTGVAMVTDISIYGICPACHWLAVSTRDLNLRHSSMSVDYLLDKEAPIAFCPYMVILMA